MPQLAAIPGGFSGISAVSDRDSDRERCHANTSERGPEMHCDPSAGRWCSGPARCRGALIGKAACSSRGVTPRSRTATCRGATSAASWAATAARRQKRGAVPSRGATAMGGRRRDGRNPSGFQPLAPGLAVRAQRAHVSGGLRQRRCRPTVLNRRRTAQFKAAVAAHRRCVLSTNRELGPKLHALIARTQHAAVTAVIAEEEATRKNRRERRSVSSEMIDS